MDIGFIRGPSNLPAVLLRTEEPALKIIESRHGYVCYLLIIDKRSRYTWTFPLKSKSVPLTLVRTFLNVHGNTTASNRTIRTDGEGSLAQSTDFRVMIPTLARISSTENGNRLLVPKRISGTSSPNSGDNGEVPAIFSIFVYPVLGRRTGVCHVR